MREPVFNETLQLGIVVRDLEATMRRYVDDYGVGPWEVYEFDAGKAEDFREYGQPDERSWRLAVATVSQVQWELIEPLDEESVYARFLAEKGEGVHHVAVATPDFDETVAQADRGNGMILSGEFGGRVPGNGPRSRGGHRNLQRHRCGRSPGRERPLTPGWVHAQAAEPGSAMTRMPRPTSVFRTTSEN